MSQAHSYEPGKRKEECAHAHKDMHTEHANLCSVLKIAKVCFVDMKPFSTSLSFRLSSGNMYFFSFS